MLKTNILIFSIKKNYFNNPISVYTQMQIIQHDFPVVILPLKNGGLSGCE